jgi:sulfur-carrier protein
MAGSIHIVYFAALAQELGLREEDLPCDAPVSLQVLRELLILRGGVWRALESSQIKSAVNQSMANWDRLINCGDEVAFFPPVTGG